MITEQTYQEMKKIIADYENRIIDSTDKKENPYIEIVSVEVHFKYNPKYGDDRVCICGHDYYRHFDTYEDMKNVGCKYCGCGEFIEESKE